MLEIDGQSQIKGITFKRRDKIIKLIENCCIQLKIGMKSDF